MTCKNKVCSIRELAEQINCKLHGLVGNFGARHAMNYVRVRFLISCITKKGAAERHNDIAGAIPPDFWMYVGEVG
jgi:hypothetical protein